MPQLVVIAGVLGVGAWLMKETGDAARDSADLVKWLTAAGVVYVSYQAAKKAGLV